MLKLPPPTTRRTTSTFLGPDGFAAGKNSFFPFPEDDDLGATDFEAVCSSGIRLRHQPLPGWIRDRGKWSDPARYGKY